MVQHLIPICDAMSLLELLFFLGNYEVRLLIYIYTHTNICSYTHICLYTYMYIYPHICIYTCIYLYMYKHIFIYVYNVLFIRMLCIVRMHPTAQCVQQIRCLLCRKKSTFSLQLKTAFKWQPERHRELSIRQC